jgi:hypothetical protein
MEEALDARVEARLTESIWGVAIVLFSVFWWKWMPPWGTATVFVLTLITFGRWFLAVQKRNAPGKNRPAALKYFAARIQKAIQGRAKALK